MDESIKGLEVGILPITYRCNAKCTMCGIGDLKEHVELSLEEYKSLFSDPIWSTNIKSVNITGGEPFLRNDLLQLVGNLYNKSKNIKTIVVNTNGILTDRIVEFVKNIIPLINSNKKTSLKIYISLDGLGTHHDEIRKIKGCFENVNKTICELIKIREEYDFEIILNCTVINDNYKNIYEVYEYAIDHKVEINYTYAMTSNIYFQNNEKVTELDKNKREYFIEFLKMFINTEAGKKMSSYYRNLIKMLMGEKRMIGCIFQEKGVFIHPSGSVFRCWVHDKEIGNIKNDSLNEIWMKQNEKCTVEDIKKRCESCFNNCYQEYQRLTTIEKMFQ